MPGAAPRGASRAIALAAQAPRRRLPTKPPPSSHVARHIVRPEKNSGPHGFVGLDLVIGRARREARSGCTRDDARASPRPRVGMFCATPRPTAYVLQHLALRATSSHPIRADLEPMLCLTKANLSKGGHLNVPLLRTRQRETSWAKQGLKT